MRATKHRSRPAPEWNTSSELLAVNPLYLMAKVGPSVFQLRDESNQGMKVTLGNPHACSCGKVDCIHIAYCVLKVLKVPASHPLSYQSSWTDNEMDQVLSGACSPPTRRQINRLVAAPVAAGVAADQVGGAGVEESKPSSNGFVTRKEVDSDSCCPICQEAMSLSKGPPLTWCRRGCGNSLHASCMSIYVDHQTSGTGNHGHNRQAAAARPCVCPFCRSDWDLPLLKLDLVGDRDKSKAASSIAPIKCSFCRGGVISRLTGQGTFYRCVPCSLRPAVPKSNSDNGQAPSSLRLCKPVDLCQDCFPRWGHGASHGQGHHDHPFLEGEAAFDHWLLGPSCHDRSLLAILADSLPMPGPHEAIGPGLCLSCHSPAAANETAILPCRHLIHRRCLETELGLLVGNIQQQVDDDNDNPLQAVIRVARRFRCTAVGCGMRVFPVLLRKPDRLPTNKNDNSNNSHGGLLLGSSVHRDLNHHSQDIMGGNSMMAMMAATGQGLLLPGNPTNNNNTSSNRRSSSSTNRAISAPGAAHDHIDRSLSLSLAAVSVSVSSRQTTVGVRTANDDGARVLPLPGGGPPAAAANTNNANSHGSLQLGSNSSSLLLSEANPNSAKHNRPQQQQRSKIGALSSLNRPPRPSASSVANNNMAMTTAHMMDEDRQGEISLGRLSSAAAPSATITVTDDNRYRMSGSNNKAKPPRIQRGGNGDEQREREEACRDMSIQARPLLVLMQQQSQQQLLSGGSGKSHSHSSSSSSRPAGRLARLGMLRVSSSAASSSSSLLLLSEEPPQQLGEATNNNRADVFDALPARPRTRIDSSQQQEAQRDLHLLTIRHYGNNNSDNNN